jgi:hypothetical protein
MNPKNFGWAILNVDVVGSQPCQQIKATLSRFENDFASFSFFSKVGIIRIKSPVENDGIARKFYNITTMTQNRLNDLWMGFKLFSGPTKK